MLEDEVLDLREEIEVIVRDELDLYFTVVSNCMGREQKPTLKDKGTNIFYSYDVFTKVTWFSLAKSTREYKRKHGGNENAKWYSYRPKPKGGQPLKDYLNGLSGDNFDCEIEIEEVDSGYYGAQQKRRVKKQGYKLTLRIYLDEDYIYESMEEDQARKAFGAPKGVTNEESRPIFNPVAEYFVRQRIPRIIKEKIKNVEFN